MSLALQMVMLLDLYTSAEFAHLVYSHVTFAWKKL